MAYDSSVNPRLLRRLRWWLRLATSRALSGLARRQNHVWLGGSLIGLRPPPLGISHHRLLFYPAEIRGLRSALGVRRSLIPYFTMNARTSQQISQPRRGFRSPRYVLCLGQRGAYFCSPIRSSFTRFPRNNSAGYPPSGVGSGLTATAAGASSRIPSRTSSLPVPISRLSLVCLPPVRHVLR